MRIMRKSVTTYIGLSLYYLEPCYKINMRQYAISLTREIRILQISSFLRSQIKDVTTFSHSSEIYKTKIHIQSTLIISTSVISNHRLSRRENLVLVLTSKSKIRSQNIVEKSRNFSPFPQYFQYIFITKEVTLHSHL